MMIDTLSICSGVFSYKNPPALPKRSLISYKFATYSPANLPKVTARPMLTPGISYDGFLNNILLIPILRNFNKLHPNINYLFSKDPNRQSR